LPLNGSGLNREESPLSTLKPSKGELALLKKWGRPREALAVFPGGLTKLYEMMSDGRVESKKVDGMRLVNLESAANPK
jgi:hypothetical protein